MTTKTGEFHATGDDGQQYVVQIYKHFFADKTGRMTESQELLTDEGLLVRRVGRGEYKVVPTGVTLTSADKAAP